MAELLSQSQFAKLIGVNQSHISRLIKKGKISTKSGKIDPDIAIHELKINLKSGGKKTKAKIGQSSQGLVGGQSSDKRSPSGKGAGGRVPSVPNISIEDIPEEEANISFFEAQRRHEVYKAFLKKIEYEKEVGQVLPAEETKKAIFDLMKMIKDTLLNVPDRISPAVSSDPEIQHLVREGLKAEIRLLLESMSNDFTKKVGI